MAGALLVVVLGVVAYLGLQIRLSNPAMTETQLFLTFWREYAAMCVASVCATVLYRLAHEDD